MVAMLLVPFALAAVVGTILLFPFGDGPQTDGGVGRPVNGTVTATETGPCNSGVQVGEQQPDAPQCLVVRVRMTDGEAPGQEISAIVPQEPSTPRFAVDDDVVLSYGGSDPRESSSYQLVDFQRDVPLALLAGWFAVAILVMGRWQGLRALIGLGLSFLVLVFFVLPAILAGENPLLVAVCGAGVIMFAVLYLTHGLSARTSTAVLGTMVSLTMIGVLGTLWASLTSLTGLDEETATLAGLLNSPIDTRGLLLAGIVIGALGVLDDVTVTQTSAVWELRAANPLLTRRELYSSALRIGRDHVASAVNTLVMAYAGAALPLLLYSSISGVGLGSILTSQSVAQELVRTLVGSIGLVAAVPITTALSVAVASQEPVLESVEQGRTPRKKDRLAAVRGKQAKRGTDRSERRPERNGRAPAQRNGHSPGQAPWAPGSRAPDPVRPGQRGAGNGHAAERGGAGRTAYRREPAEHGTRTVRGREVGLPAGSGGGGPVGSGGGGPAGSGGSARHASHGVGRVETPGQVNGGGNGALGGADGHDNGGQMNGRTGGPANRSRMSGGANGGADDHTNRHANRGHVNGGGNSRADGHANRGRMSGGGNGGGDGHVNGHAHRSHVNGGGNGGADSHANGHANRGGGNGGGGWDVPPASYVNGGSHSAGRVNGGSYPATGADLPSRGPGPSPSRGQGQAAGQDHHHHQDQWSWFEDDLDG